MPRRDRWYCGSSAETIGGRELKRLLDAYRADGAHVTGDGDGGWLVYLPGEPARSYERVPG